MTKSKEVSDTIDCRKCKHPHVAKTGPCTKVGCGCTATETHRK